MTMLLITDMAHSVLGAGGPRAGYTPAGYTSGAVGACGFHGQRLDGHGTFYVLGHGRRAYGPAQMRFIQPDVLSPFAEGGLNSYAYCGAEPVNRADPTGQFFVALRRLLGRVSKNRGGPLRDLSTTLTPAASLRTNTTANLWRDGGPLPKFNRFSRGGAPDGFVSNRFRKRAQAPIDRGLSDLAPQSPAARPSLRLPAEPAPDYGPLALPVVRAKRGRAMKVRFQEEASVVVYPADCPDIPLADALNAKVPIFRETL
ncbi:RHS repeat-associated core domain-containing protein [Pseudomonas typographi]|uniref:RHS repeat-associated core domain-containing protein n=1 Tax=Pseudomonas typographi TaxID=2715964 RepID=A0ABR7Z3Q3_9PSED|nr:RHS repeat-associated core domain-containing protein [Pseudomonas typographi]MBD1586528.1 RHS repeat-associated core domain-containing protein [Pseudomonas typographi]MBD1600029.1 RHS repeat-associated core domain-containing protein [Pseudomonas typographi]